MGGTASKGHNAPPCNPVPAGKTRVCVAGYKVSHHTGRARKLAHLIAKNFPDQFETYFYFDSGNCYHNFLMEKFDNVSFPDHLKGHDSSPFVWLEAPDGTITPIGGRQAFQEWIALQSTPVKLMECKEIEECTKNPKSAPSVTEAFHGGSTGGFHGTADISRKEAEQ